MTVNNTAVRTPVSPAPHSQAGASRGTGNAFVPSNAPNNPSKDNKGDAVGNAVCSVLTYVFEVLPGRATGALTPVASDAQSRTPQLMANAHAQDAITANQGSWDSWLWVKAGDAFMAAWDRVESALQFGNAPAPRETLTALKSSLTPDYELVESQALIDYRKKGGDSATGMVILFGDTDHDDDGIQALLRSTISTKARPDLGDKGTFEFVGGTEEYKAEVCRGIPAELCSFLTEHSATRKAQAASADAVYELKATLIKPSN